MDSLKVVTWIDQLSKVAKLSNQDLYQIIFWIFQIEIFVFLMKIWFSGSRVEFSAFHSFSNSHSIGIFACSAILNRNRFIIMPLTGTIMQIKCKSRTFTSTYFHFLEFSVFQSIHPGSIIVGYVHIFPALEMMDWL